MYLLNSLVSTQGISEDVWLTLRLYTCKEKLVLQRLVPRRAFMYWSFTFVGMMWHADRSLHYYLDGMDMGKAWYVPHLNIYAVVDLYGQCTQVLKKPVWHTYKHPTCIRYQKYTYLQRYIFPVNQVNSFRVKLIIIMSMENAIDW